MAGVKLGMLKVLVIQIDLDGLRVVVVERGEGLLGFAYLVWLELGVASNQEHRTWWGVG